MFAGILREPPDMIMSLWAAYQSDTRPDKIDLGMGVYRAEDGSTPVMEAVRAAQRILAETETTKAYRSPIGDPDFTRALSGIVLGENAPVERMSAIQTPGGSGALALGAALLSELATAPKLLIPEQTWVNHRAIFRSAGFEVGTYPYFDAATGRVDIDAMADRLEKADPDTVVLLHGCCHNPTGADPEAEAWNRFAEIIGRRRMLPFVDLAYQGFGDGLAEDAYGVRRLAEAVPEMLVAISCSKNFAVYRERAGMLLVLAENAGEASAAQSRLASRARNTYSMPPEHGAALVRTILGDLQLTEQWISELDLMRKRIKSLRRSLAAAFRVRTNDDRHDFLERNKGMFSRLDVTPEQVSRLHQEHGVYVVDDGRINVAGLRLEQIPRFVDAVVAVS